MARNTGPYWYGPLTSHPGLLSLNSNSVVLHPQPPFLILWDAFQDENPQRSGATSPQYRSPLYASWPWLTYSAMRTSFQLGKARSGAAM